MAILFSLLVGVEISLLLRNLAKPMADSFAEFHKKKMKQKSVVAQMWTLKLLNNEKFNPEYVGKVYN
jgi:hypothetical protein